MARRLKSWKAKANAYGLSIGHIRKLQAKRRNKRKAQRKARKINRR